MLCPHCPASTLVISERSGIEIDYCPQCRGVWLDRGELDKILERSAGVPSAAVAAPMAAPMAPPAPPPVQHSAPVYQQPPQAPHYPAQPQGYHDPDIRYDKHGRPYRKKRDSWLDDIFDF